MEHVLPNEQAFNLFGVDSVESRAAWSRAAIYVAVVLMVAIVWITRKTLILFSTSLLLAYLLYPLVDAIDRKMGHRNRALAAAIPFAVLLLFSFGFGSFINQPLQKECKMLQQWTNQHDFAKEVSKWKVMEFPVGEQIADVYKNTELLKMIPALKSGAQTALRYSLNIVIIPILSFFILKDGPVLRAGLLDVFDSGKWIERFLEDAHVLLLEYMRSLLFLCLSVLITFTVVLSAMRVPYGILLAIAAFALEFVPMLGPVAAALIILGVSEFNHYTYVPWLIGFLLVYRLFQDYVLSPHLMKRGVKLHPLLVLFGVFAGDQIGDVVGIFLSIPTLALVRLAFFELRKASMQLPENRVFARLRSDAVK